MLQNIPTHIIAGPLGAGKTTLVRHLMAQRPMHERWAILVNEFGQIGLDAALLTTTEKGVVIGEVAGGCLCCVNGVPFQIGLGRLLRKARPDRLFIEPSGLGHPVQLMAQLREAPWMGVLSLQPLVMVLDAAALATGQTLGEYQRQAVVEAGLVVMNKSKALPVDEQLKISEAFTSLPILWTECTHLSLSELPSSPIDCVSVNNAGPVLKALHIPATWPDPFQPVSVSQSQPEGWSAGWRWHPERRFSTQRLRAWLEQWGWWRAKLVIHTSEGWVSGNFVAGQTLAWRASEWRQDNRIELIFSAEQPLAALTEGLSACRETPDS